MQDCCAGSQEEERKKAQDAAEPDFFFEHSDPPAGFEETKRSVREWLEGHITACRRVALVTSGGTMVPLEKNTVRFIDNFSGGNRGAASAEHLLAQGYAVIFLNRKNSLQPYARYFNLRHPTGDFIDFLTVNEKDRVEVLQEHAEVEHEVANILKAFNVVRRENRLVKVRFTSLQEYLFLLRFISMEMGRCGEKGLIYSAAAVSDFYIPANEMAEHKIQSSSNPFGLTIRLRSVPKVLHLITGVWAPDAFVISFKLETDADILAQKATTALQNYGVSMVVANLLQSYQTSILLFTKSGAQIPVKEEHGKDIEEKLVQLCVEYHTKHIGD